MVLSANHWREESEGIVKSRRSTVDAATDAPNSTCVAGRTTPTILAERLASALTFAHVRAVAPTHRSVTESVD